MTDVDLRQGNGAVSYWMGLGSRRPVPALEHDLEVDVCVVGGGLTGLWTAYWLTETSPFLSIAVLEEGQVGQGASGRSTGWLSSKLVGRPDVLARGPAGLAGVVQAQRRCMEAVDEVLAIVEEFDIPCGATKGGYLILARNPAQLSRLSATVRDQDRWGVRDGERMLLDRDESDARVRIPGVVGSLYSPQCARIDPAALTRGLARLVRSRGVQLYEGTHVDALATRGVRVGESTVTAKHVVVAVEAYASGSMHGRRNIIPLLAPMAVTSVLPESAWQQLGWSGHECVSDSAHHYMYSVRTEDGRVAFGGGAPLYRYGSQMERRPGEVTEHMRRTLDRLCGDLFGAVGASVERAWCGPIGLPRDFTPSISHDPESGRIRAMGYVGQGLTGSYLSGRAIADLVRGKETEYTALPWIGRRSPRWPVEPLRWLGTNTVSALYGAADRHEYSSASARTSRWARVADAVAAIP